MKVSTVSPRIFRGKSGTDSHQIQPPTKEKCGVSGSLRSGKLAKKTNSNSHSGSSTSSRLSFYFGLWAFLWIKAVYRCACVWTQDVFEEPFQPKSCSKNDIPFISHPATVCKLHLGPTTNLMISLAHKLKLLDPASSTKLIRFQSKSESAAFMTAFRSESNVLRARQWPQNHKGLFELW